MLALRLSRTVDSLVLRRRPYPFHRSIFQCFASDAQPRPRSSSSDVSPTSHSAAPSKRIELYERDKSRNMLPRSLLAGTTFNSLYWTWYVFDFAPALNLAAIPDLHVDPYLGYIGLACAAGLNFVSLLYPKNLISRVALQDNPENGSKPQLLITVHDLPLIHPTPFGPVYNVGEITLNVSSSESKQLLENTETSLAEFHGHLRLKAVDRDMYYFLDIQGSDKLHDPKTLLHVLMDPDGYVKLHQRRRNLMKQKASPRRTGSRKRPR